MQSGNKLEIVQFVKDNIITTTTITSTTTTTTIATTTATTTTITISTTITSTTTTTTFALQNLTYSLNCSEGSGRCGFLSFFPVFFFLFAP